MKLNKLNLNYSKSCFLLYGRSSNYYPWIDRLNIADTSILRINCTKYLGVLIAECLSFREHIGYISLKLARNVGILRKLQYIFPRDILRTIYYSLIHPYLLYCCNVWGSTFPSHLHRVRVLQNKALRVLKRFDLSVRGRVVNAPNSRAKGRWFESRWCRPFGIGRGLVAFPCKTSQKSTQLQMGT